jgi:hypothetical protein
MLPPLILPGGGRFKIGANGVNVSLRHQSSDTIGEDYVLRWRFAMNPPGRSNADNGPVIEGRIPARITTPFEEGYQFSLGRIGYKQNLCSGACDTGAPTFIFALPGVYKVYAWMEKISTGETSRTQYCVFELVPSVPSSHTSATPRLGA